MTIIVKIQKLWEIKEMRKNEKKFVRRNLMVAFLVRGRVCAVVQLLEYSGNSLCICVFQCVCVY